MRLIICGLTVALLTSCSAQTGDPSANKAGAPRQPLHVVMADSQPADAPTGLAMAAFATSVADLSKGAIEVETISAGKYADNAGDSKVVAALTAGEVQLATVPTRAWSDAGAGSTDVLQAPFEVTSNAHMAAVADDDTLVNASLAGLEKLGAHGLTLVPERLRLLVGFGHPIRRPTDLEGRIIRSISPSIGDVIESLGATTVNPTEDEYAAMRADHTIDGVETDWARAEGIASGSIATSDLVLYAKFDSIAANAAWWRGLTDDQRDVFVKAADVARHDAAQTLEDPAAQAPLFCAAGGQIVEAGPAGQRQFRSALAQVTAAVDQSALRRLRADRPTGTNPVVDQCRPAVSGLDPAHVEADAGAVPDGIYRVEFTPSLTRRWDAEHPDGLLFGEDPNLKDFRSMTQTWTLRGGHYTFEIQIDDAAPFVQTGIYQVKGDQMLLALAPDIGNVVNRLVWSIGDNGSLVLTQVDDLKRDNYYYLPWERIGN